MSDLNFENHNLPSVGIEKTTPHVTERQLASYKRCYIGISLGNPVFQGKSLEALFSWAADRFDKSLVVVGDYLCRFNEQLLHGLNAEQAAKVALELGDTFIRQTEKLFRQFDDDKLILTRWKSCLDTPEYAESKSILDNLFNEDTQFRTSVEKEAISFLKRQQKHNQSQALETEEAIKLSSQYLLEEIAVFSTLSQQGWNIELYPGPELRVLEDIAK